MGYDGQGIGKSIQGIISPIVATSMVKTQGQDFDGRWENPMTIKTTFVKVKDMTEFSFSLEERVVLNEGDNPLTPYLSYG